MNSNQRNLPCWCGSNKKYKHCHLRGESRPSGKQNPWGICIKTPHQVSGIRKACQIAAQICDELCERAQVGVRLRELDDYALKRHRELGVVPAPLNYGSPPFPASICTSLNEVVCHGIPDETELKTGDILNIDVTAISEGYFGDCSKMVSLTPCDEERSLVVATSFECLRRAIAELTPGVAIGRIGHIIESYAQTRGCGVVDAFVGHGTGLSFHEPPNIPHFFNDSEILLAPGMIFTIEPMINAGTREVEIDPANNWTARTRDRRASAQWEHTLLITETGCEVLTPWRGWNDPAAP